MDYQKRLSKKHCEDAVSPVVGVMLMLVVTIIIAAVVSGFAGGLIGSNNQKSPTLAMDVKIANSGSWIGSGFSAFVTGVSEPIQTKDLKLVTSWKTTNRETGAAIMGGNISKANVANFDCYIGMKTSNRRQVPAPFGHGTGVAGIQDTTNMANYTQQHFGNYSLIVGTNMEAMPYGSTSGTAIGGAVGTSDSGGYGVTTPYTYTAGGSYTTDMIDATTAILGRGWENLRTGDIVTVRVVYVPTGSTIFNKDIPVTEG
jgi:archaeal type IV pilus assembly protein PilA